MTDTTTKFDPIPRLQQIATIIKESGADIFYAPTTVAYDIDCAIKEIERLREELTASHESHGNEVGALAERLSLAIHERDEARRMWCEAAPVGNSLSVDDMDRRARAEANRRGWDCFKEDTDD